MKNLLNCLIRNMSIILITGLIFSSFLFIKNTPITHAQPKIDPANTLNIDPILGWNTFFGSGEWPTSGDEVASDRNGNVYVIGESGAEWGNPISKYSDGNDAYVVNLDSNGVLVWLTFLGGSLDDSGHGITVDSNSNIYVVGTSNGSLGNPINPFNGLSEAFVAKLNSSGVLQWNTFMGGLNQFDNGWDIALDDDGYIYVVGRSTTSWGNPVNDHVGDYDTFVSKLNNNGEQQWNTFMGSAGEDRGYGIAVDGSGNIYVAGNSETTWGSPVNDHSGDDDAYAAKLNNDGALLWNTFMGSADYDYGRDIGVDRSGNVYVVGGSDDTWGSPIISHAGQVDLFVAGLDSSGALQWNTFLGSTRAGEGGKSLAMSSSGDIFVAGNTMGSWGDPAQPYMGGQDVFAAKLASNGTLLWNTFIGTLNYEHSGGIAVDYSGNVYLSGDTPETWGDPVNPHTEGTDNFAVKFNSPEIKLFLPNILR